MEREEEREEREESEEREGSETKKWERNKYGRWRYIHNIPTSMKEVSTYQVRLSFQNFHFPVFQIL